MEYTIPPYVGAFSAGEAREQCQKEGGTLARVVDFVDNDKLLDILLRYKRDRATLGAVRVGEGWEWQDNHDEEWKFDNWAVGQPDNKLDRCSEMWTTGEWNDIPCGDGPRAYFCQVPTPKDNLTFPCTHGVTKALGHQATCRYEVSLFDRPAKKDMYWETAVGKCKAMGHATQIAQPKNAEQNQYLASLLRKHRAESMWIGLYKTSNTQDRDGYFWADGSRLEHGDAHWAVTEPNGDPGDCVEMWEDGTWNDRSCDLGKVLACEVVVG